jgi:hypothetical protein
VATIYWGSWSSNNRLRCGMSFSQSPSSVSHSTSSVTITVDLYLQTRYASNESGSNTTPWSVSNAWSDSGYGDGWNLGAMDYKNIGSTSHTYTLSYGSGSSHDLTGKFTSTYAYPGTSATRTITIPIPARPIATPAAITNLNWARVSDTQQTITWTNNSPTDSAAPYQKIYLDRQIDNGTWVTIWSTSSVVSSYTDKGTIGNHEYQYRIRPWNSAGFCPTYAYSTTFYTTAAAPSSCAATKLDDGDIQVSWHDNSGYNPTFTIYHASNGVWDASPLATQNDVAGADPETYIHTNPSTTVTHAYRIKANTTPPALSSAYSNTSNTVQLLSAPDAPTKTVASTSSGGAAATVFDASNPIYLSWQHNPNDTTNQTHYQIEYQIDGGAFTVISEVASGTSKATIAAGTWANGHTIGWRVRTWGAYASAGPYSATATLTTSTQPTVVVNTPDGVTPYATSTLIPVWGYGQAEGSAQASWRIRLYDANMNIIETKSGSGTADTTTMSTVLTNATNYTVGATVWSALGLESDEFQQAMTTSFALPPAPTLTAVWDADSGAVQLSVDTPDPVDPQIAADHIQVWRQITGDPNWYLVADNVPLSTTVNDWIPALRTTNTYLAVAVTTLPSIAVGTATPVDTTPGCHHVWVNAGGSFSSSACFTTDVSISLDDGIDRVLNQYAGRTKPVESMGEQTEYALTLSASIYDPLVASSVAAETSSVDVIGRVAKNAAPACVRTPDGMRRFVSLGIPQFGKLGPAKVRTVSWAITEVDYTEPTGLAS